jgi:hypothetical protein
MVDIVVKRDGGNHPGDDIIEPLFGNSRAAALSRGRAELDARAGGKIETRIEVPFERGRRSGQLIEAHDPDSGTLYRGKIIEIRIAASLPVLTHSLTLERKGGFAV